MPYHHKSSGYATVYILLVYWAVAVVGTGVSAVNVFLLKTLCAIFYKVHILNANKAL